MNIQTMGKPAVRKIQCNSKGQWTLTIPKTMVGILELNPGDPMCIDYSVTEDGQGYLIVWRDEE